MKGDLTIDQILETYQRDWNPTEFVLFGPGGESSELRTLQSEHDLREFLEVVLDRLPMDRRRVAIETGLYQGGSHLLWRSIFEKVITIDINVASCLRFAGAVQNREGSVVICANSALPATREYVRKVLGDEPVDFLFIDGDHSGPGVLSDFANYEQFVQPGGVVGFHDVGNKGAMGVQNFVAALEEGRHFLSDRVGDMYRTTGKPGTAFYIKP